MSVTKIFGIVILIQILSLCTFAAPHPGTGSSIVNQLDWGTMFSQMGFKVNHVPKEWKALPLTSSDQPQIDLGNDDQIDKGRLSFKMDELKTRINLETYVKRFLRDYNQYGYEVLGMQSYKKDVNPSIVLDLVQKNKKSRSRQMFFYKNDRVIVATCVDEYASFDKTVLKCNKVLESFTWQ